MIETADDRPYRHAVVVGNTFYTQYMGQFLINRNLNYGKPVKGPVVREMIALSSAR
jgi:hypothetical protein